MKDFAEFRASVLTDERVKEIVSLAETQAGTLDNELNWFATFCANFSLRMLADYHDWASRDEA